MNNYSFVSNLMENTQFIPTEKYIHHTLGIYLRIRQLFSCALNEVSPAFIILCTVTPIRACGIRVLN